MLRSTDNITARQDISSSLWHLPKQHCRHRHLDQGCLSSPACVLSRAFCQGKRYQNPYVLDFPDRSPCLQIEKAGIFKDSATRSPKSRLLLRVKTQRLSVLTVRGHEGAPGTSRGPAPRPAPACPALQTGVSHPRRFPPDTGTPGRLPPHDSSR